MLTRAAGHLAGFDPAMLFAPVAQEEKIGLAVSGGPDSLALLMLYTHWRDTAGAPPAIVYTVDHRLRPEAAAEAELVRRLAIERGFEVRMLQWNGAKPETGIQAAARVARYRLMGAAMEEDGAGILLTAHHLDDQAETVLMRLAHGSGARGLGAMRAFSEVEGVKIFRPLLGVRKEQLRAIVNAHGLRAAEDPGNADQGYERARWRAMRPVLDEAGLTPERLAQFAGRMQRLDGLAARIAEDIWRAHVRVDDFGIVHIGNNVFTDVREEAGLRVLRRALRHAGGGQRGELSAIEALHERLMRGQADAPVTLMGAVVAPRPKEVLIYREAGRQGLPKARAEAEHAVVWDGRFTIEAADDVAIASASSLTRRHFSELTGSVPEVPVAALRTAPLVTDMAGRILALGARVFDPCVRVGHVALT